MSKGGAGEGLASPYVGLRPYTDREESIFFGRERERRIVSSNLVASRLTLLYGPSGVGKSSILNAAVVPHLRAMASEEEGEDGGSAYDVVVFNAWRDEPVADLIRCLAAAGGNPAGAGPVAPDTAVPLAAALRTWADTRQTDLLLILDQFEEYFLYHGRLGGDDRFAREFPEAVNDPGLRVNFLVSFREDALASLDLFKGRVPRLFGNYLRIGYLDAEGAGGAIRGPVDGYNRGHPGDPVTIEPALVERVLEDVEAGKVVVGQAGAGAVEGPPVGASQSAIETSHLQIVMARLWSEEVSTGSGALRVATLDRLGGAAEIVRSHLDRELTSLSESEQDVAAAAFEHLVTPSGTKIAHSAPDLAILAGVAEVELIGVLKRLSAGASRILRPVEPSPGRSDERYEIFHDVLAAAILDWRTRYVQQRERVAAEEELREQRRQAEEQARAARRRARNISVFSLVAALLVVALVLAANARRQSTLASSRQQAAEALSYLSVDPIRSVRGALSALDTASTPEAESALRRAVAGSQVRSVLTGHKDWVNTVAFDPRGETLVTSSSDNTARLWDVATGTERAVLAGHTHWVATGTFDPSGRTVLTASADGTAMLWDASTGAELRPLAPETPAPGPLVTASFDPAGTTVVTAGDDAVVRLWDAASGRQLRELRGHSPIVTAARFDPSGTRVVTSSSDGTVRVWDAGTGLELARFDGHEGRVADAVFSPDGTLVATAGTDTKAFVWRWQTGESVALLGHTEELVSVEFDPGGGRVVTAGDTTARVWGTATGQIVAALRGHGGPLTAARFNSDGRRLATASQDGSARIWDLATASTLIELRGHPEIVWDVAFSPVNDRLLATAGSDGTARLWELPEQLTLAHPGAVLAAEFSGDGRSIVTSDGATARVWDATTGRQETTLPGHDGQVLASFSPDARLVVTIDHTRVRVWDRRGGDAPLAETSEVRRGIARFTPGGDAVIVSDEDGTLYRWDWRNGGALRRLTGYRGTGTVTDVDISTDGRWVLTAGSDRVARIWDLSTGRERTTLRGHDGVLYGARFSHDGRLVVTSSADGTARIWDAETGRQTRSLVTDRGLRTAAFDRTGARVVAGALDGSVRIWDARSGRTLSVLSRHTTTVNSAVFSPDGRLILSASDDWTATIYECRTCGGVRALRAQAGKLLAGIPQTAEQTVTEWALVPGDCYDTTGRYATIVDCGSPHESEVFAVIEHPAGYDVPFDQEQVSSYARQQCEGKPFADYVRRPQAASEYQVSPWTPHRGTWDAGDRRIACALYGSERLTGTARGTGR